MTTIQAIQKMEVQPEWAFSRRRAFLLTELQGIAEERTGIHKYLPQSNAGERSLYLGRLEDLNKKYRSLQAKLYNLENPGKGKISDEDIESARQADITKYIPGKIKRGMTTCFSHEDKTPSMLVNDNWVWCFACVKKWNTIDVVGEIRGLDFVGAVKYINGP